MIEITNIAKNKLIIVTFHLIKLSSCKNIVSPPKTLIIPKNIQYRIGTGSFFTRKKIKNARITKIETFFCSLLR